MYISPEDFIYDKAAGTLYVNRVNDWGSTWPNGVGNAIQKIDYRSLKATTIYTHQGYYNKAESLTWIDWIGFYKDKIVSLNSGYGVEIRK